MSTEANEHALQTNSGKQCEICEDQEPLNAEGFCRSCVVDMEFVDALNAADSGPSPESA